MPANELHIGDVGTTFTFTIYNGDSEIVNLAGATVSIIFKNPNGVLINKIGDIVGDGSSGVVEYVTIAGDIDLAGSWSVQGYVDFGSSYYYTDIQKFKVFRNL